MRVEWSGKRWRGEGKESVSFKLSVRRVSVSCVSGSGVGDD